MAAGRSRRLPEDLAPATAPSVFMEFPFLMPREMHEIRAFLSSPEAATSDVPDVLAARLSDRFGFSEDVSRLLVPVLLAPSSSVSPRELILYPEDVEHLTSPLLPTVPDFTLVHSYLTVLVLHIRLHPHPSGWIKCDASDMKAVARFAASAASLSVSSSRRTAVMNTLHSVYGLEMRVSGSKNPVPCIRFAWQEQSPSSVPLDFGPVTEEALKALLSHLESVRLDRLRQAAEDIEDGESSTETTTGGSSHGQQQKQI